MTEADLAQVSRDELIAIILTQYHAECGDSK
jgi:hypothetical protein